MERLPHLLEGRLEGWEGQVSAIAQKLSEARTFLYLGRAIHYAIAREGALKLKESAYVQAEGLPAGELKHGPNALVSPEAPLVMLATRDRNDPDSTLRYEKTLQLMRDMHAQGAEILAIHVEGDVEAAQNSAATRSRFRRSTSFCCRSSRWSRCRCSLTLLRCSVG